MKNLTIREAFRQTQDSRGIKNKDLASLANVGPQHIACIRNGKAWPSEDVLMKLIDAMEQLSPGARRDFGLLIAGGWEDDQLKALLANVSPSQLLAAIGNQKFAALVNAFAESLQDNFSSVRNYTDEIISSCSDETIDKKVYKEPVGISSSRF